MPEQVSYEERISYLESRIEKLESIIAERSNLQGIELIKDLVHESQDKMISFEDICFELNLTRPTLSRLMRWIRTDTSFKIIRDSSDKRRKYLALNQVDSASIKVPPKKTEEENYIYIIKAPGRRYKIGVSKDPKQRLGELNGGCPFPTRYKIIHLIKTTNSLKAEKVLHAKYKNRKIKGEWFMLADAEIRELLKIKELNDFTLSLSDNLLI